MKKLVVLAVSGSIAAVRSFDLARLLRKHGFEVQVVMSRSAEGIISSASMEWASGRKVISNISGAVEHVEFFGKGGNASLLLIAPATANTISKIAMAIDDNAITTMATTAIGSKIPVLICPAMHGPMYEHPIVKKNLELLENEKRLHIIMPLVEEEKAKMASVEQIVAEVERELSGKKLCGKKFLVANGATYSRIDPVRVVTNLSSGKMGRALATELYRNGAEVKVVEGKEHTAFVNEVLLELEKGYDFFACPAAINDFKTKEYRNKASSAKKLVLELEPTEKLLSIVRKKFPRTKIIAFKAETNKSKKELEKIGKEFLKKNGFFMVVANDVVKNPAGLDESEMVIVPAKGKMEWVKDSKEMIARQVVDSICLLTKKLD